MREDSAFHMRTEARRRYLQLVDMLALAGPRDFSFFFWRAARLRQCLRSGASVVLGCRSEGSSAAAVARLGAESGRCEKTCSRIQYIAQFNRLIAKDRKMMPRLTGLRQSDVNWTAPVLQ